MKQYTSLHGSADRLADFVLHRDGAWTWRFLPEYSSRFSRPNLIDWMTGNRRETLVERGNRVVISSGAADGVVVCRIIRCGSLRERIGSTLFRSVAHHNYRANTACRRVNIATPKPMGFGEKRERGMVVASCEVNEYVPDQISLIDILDRDPAWYRGCARRLGAMAAALHNASVYHGDLTPKNLSVSRRTHDCRTMYLYDFDKMRIGRRFRHRRRKDLMKLLALSYRMPFSDADRNELCAAYQESTGISGACLKRTRRLALKNFARLSAGKTVDTLPGRERILARGYL